MKRYTDAYSSASIPKPAVSSIHRILLKLFMIVKITVVQITTHFYCEICLDVFQIKSQIFLIFLSLIYFGHQ